MHLLLVTAIYPRIVPTLREHFVDLVIWSTEAPSLALVHEPTVAISGSTVSQKFTNKVLPAVRWG